jgi:hypothetical protein
MIIFLISLISLILLILRPSLAGNPSARRLDRLWHHEYELASPSRPASIPAESCRAVLPSRSTQILAARHATAQRDVPAPIGGVPPYVIGRPHFSGSRGAFRGFLPWGLSNTCPQAAVVFGAVRRKGGIGQSDNPQQLRVFGSPPRMTSPAQSRRSCLSRVNSSTYASPTPKDRRPHQGQSDRRSRRITDQHRRALASIENRK